MRSKRGAAVGRPILHAVAGLPRAARGLALAAAVSAAAAIFLASAGCREETDGVLVFAAASLGPAVEEILAGRDEVKVSLGASSTLARQIVAGAPADVFLCADRRWADAVDGPGGRVAERQEALANRVVLAVRAADRGSITRLTDLEGPAVRRVSTGDPAHVPLGLYARRGLVALGAWEAVAPKILAAEDARVALLYLERGEVDAGLLYASDVAGAADLAEAAELPLPPGEGVAYPFLLLAHGEGEGARSPTAAARRTYDLLLSEASLAVFERRGFRRTAAE